MKRGVRAALVGSIGLIACLWLAGCSGPRLVTVKGKVTEKGEPLSVSQTGIVRITLVPVSPEAQGYNTYLAEANKADGSFEIKDIPAGKYRVAIEQLDPNPQQDKLKGAFSLQNSKVIRDVEGKEPLDLDLSNLPR